MTSKTRAARSYRLPPCLAARSESAAASRLPDDWQAPSPRGRGGGGDHFVVGNYYRTHGPWPIYHRWPKETNREPADCLLKDALRLINDYTVSAFNSFLYIGSPAGALCQTLIGDGDHCTQFTGSERVRRQTSARAKRHGRRPSCSWHELSEGDLLSPFEERQFLSCPSR